ncbi:MAG TPA: sigma factor-like helix-turn-helix DNA-binding protein, partial [Chitinophagales bacterium]|nr:sigma factor-like helix-turn-helix DNA-binding protein [Chitinophagales bacterium]
AADSEIAYRESLKNEINRSLATLTSKQAEVLKLYFGIDMPHAMSLEDIGLKFDLTRERVRQIKDKALIRLKTTSRCKLLKDYLG